MLMAPADLMIYVATQPVDFKKGADGLALLAKETLGPDPIKGVAVVFRAKRARNFHHQISGFTIPKTLRSQSTAPCAVSLALAERLLKLANDARFGRTSEKLDADQLQLVLEDLDGAVAALEAAEDRGDPKTCKKRTAERRANRGQLPENLPRIVETLMPAETCCPSCEGVLFEIGCDEGQRLDVVPTQYRVIVTRRLVMASFSSTPRRND
jgi:transposase